MSNKNRYLTEMDEYQDAVSRINIFETALPVLHGNVIADTDTYNKIQRILAVPEMEECHQFLYDIDFDQMNSQTVQKVNDLYNLGVKRGLIEDKPEEAEEEDGVTKGEITEDDPEAAAVGAEDEEGEDEYDAPKTWSEIEPPTEIPNQIATPNHCYTCFYSAMKDGTVKTGEAYSMAIDVPSAKADVIDNLTKLGMSDINIIAVEIGEEAPESIEESDTEDDVENPPKEDEKEEKEEKEEKKDEEKPEDKKEEKEEKKEEKKDDEEEEPKELSNEEKAELVQKYVGVWKSALKDMKETSYSTIKLENVGNFWKKIAQNWPEGNPDPREFMSAENIEKLENLKVKVEK